MLILSWEYPPVVVGGLGRHVHGLSVALAAAGHEVTVMTRGADDGTSPALIVFEGVRIIRTEPDPAVPKIGPDDIVTWALAFNHALTRGALALEGPFDVVHVHDWLVAHAGVNLSVATGAPLVVTVHATESGRHGDSLRTDLHRKIHGVERWMLESANRVVVCSTHMRDEVQCLFAPAVGLVEVVPNGVDARAWSPLAQPVARSSVGEHSSGPLLACIARLVREKGVGDLIRATALLRHRHRGLRVVVAGEGHRREDLLAEAAKQGVQDIVDLVGFVPQDQLAELLAAASVVVIPSRYEPFGLVALEAAAAGVPRVVAATGGLLEHVQNERNALTYPPGDVEALVAAIDRVLLEAGLAERLVRTAADDLRSVPSWDEVAATVTGVYECARATMCAP